MTVQEAPARTPSATQVTCPRCGARAERDQLFCLECGERLSIGYRRPPSWRLPAAIIAGVVLITGAAMAFALVEITDDADRVASAPGPTAPPAQTAPQGEEAAEEEEPPAPDEGQAAGESQEWPDDTSGYPVILLSTTTRGGAETTARQAIQAGVPAGVLRSSDYSSLNPGFWVVFAGELDSIEEAQREAERYAGLGFAGGYPRFVNGGE